MGLTLDVFSFAATPPTRGELEAHLRASVGSARAVESFDIEGPRVELRCALDAVAHAYAVAFLIERGGRRIDRTTGAPRPVDLPWYVDRPLRRWGLFDRLRILLGIEPPRSKREGRYR